MAVDYHILNQVVTLIAAPTGQQHTSPVLYQWHFASPALCHDLVCKHLSLPQDITLVHNHDADWT